MPQPPQLFGIGGEIEVLVDLAVAVVVGLVADLGAGALALAAVFLAVVGILEAVLAFVFAGAELAVNGGGGDGGTGDAALSALEDVAHHVLGRDVVDGAVAVVVDAVADLGSRLAAVGGSQDHVGDHRAVDGQGGVLLARARFRRGAKDGQVVLPLLTAERRDQRDEEHERNPGETAGLQGRTRANLCAKARRDHPLSLRGIHAPATPGSRHPIPAGERRAAHHHPEQQGVAHGAQAAFGHQPLDVVEALEGLLGADLRDSSSCSARRRLISAAPAGARGRRPGRTR
jgi:hypothetical protein